MFPSSSVLLSIPQTKKQTVADDASFGQATRGYGMASPSAKSEGRRSTSRRAGRRRRWEMSELTPLEIMLMITMMEMIYDNNNTNAKAGGGGGGKGKGCHCRQHRRRNFHSLSLSLSLPYLYSPAFRTPQFAPSPPLYPMPCPLPPSLSPTSPASSRPHLAVTDKITVSPRPMTTLISGDCVPSNYHNDIDHSLPDRGTERHTCHGSRNRVKTKEKMRRE